MSRTALACVLMAAALSGCSKLVPKLDEVLPDNRKDYKKAQTLPDLEVPPDLSSEAIKDRMAIPEGGKTAKYSTYQERRAERQKVAEVEKSNTAAVRVLENEHVLSIAGAPVQVWPKLRDFWATQGYKLELDDVDLGVIETGWSEDKAKLSRDKFKLFAEAGAEAGTTVLYLSHEGQELTPKGESLEWQRKPRDVDAERQMVDSLQTYLAGQGTSVVSQSSPGDGAATAATAAPEAPVAAAEAADSGAAAATPAALTGEHHADIVTVGGGKTYLSLAEEFPTAWKSTGAALEQVGVQIKDSDKGRGVYIVKVTGAGGETGGLSKLKFWSRDGAKELQVSLTGVGPKTEVVVLDRDGRWETGEAAATLLKKLHTALNGGHG
ncbi:MAG: outer membrane protein assembly factor BamC [Proteobacteria bacterium]|jgi:outer membrane protein assembly factor BamC|nr:outer membrane protein assembly factor BamC [Pseudomonadota bacterium]